MPHWLRALLGALVSLAFAVPAHACSLLMTSIVRGTAPYFVFTATADTASVPAWAPQMRNPLETLSTFGQRVRITQLGEDAAPDVRDSLRRSRGQAVLVPWTLSSECRTEGWGRASYRWITSSVPAFISAELRPRSGWADGTPTFDVYIAYLEPFPHESWLGARHFRDPPKDRSQLLSAEEYLGMYAALPTSGEWELAPAESRKQIERWLQANPRLAARYPANALLDEAEEKRRWAEQEAELKRLRSIQPPLAGTYQLEVKVDGGASRTFYVRTRSGPTSAWTVRPGADSLTGAERIRQRDGYSILSSGSLDPEALPTSCEQGRQMEREGYLYLLENPEVRRDSSQLWQGQIGMSLLARQFPSDTALKALPQQDQRRYAERSREGLRQETPARFVSRPDGSVRVEQSLTWESGRTVAIRGERVSATSISCRW